MNRFKRINEIKEVYEGIIKDGKSPLIIDCGGNIGLATKYLSDEYPRGRFVLIEPDEGNIEQAKINNENTVIDYIQAAIGSAAGHGKIFDPGLGQNGYRIIEAGDGDLAIVAINDLINNYPLEKFKPFMIKIDIEGFESDLFSKNTEWIERFPILIIELHDWMLPKSSNSNSFLKAISKENRDFIYFGENIFSIKN